MASHNRKDLKGKRFGRLVVIEPAETVNGKLHWLCICDCGKEKTVASGALRGGRTKSCGCLRYEMVSRGELHKRHGMSNTRLYSIWSGIKKRCDSKDEDNYHLYGGRGITYCEEWSRFEPFRDWALSNGYSNNLTIDRIDVNGNYCPENCRWITVMGQGCNKRNNRKITYNGETLIISEWDRRIGSAKSGRVNERLKAGWSIEDAVTIPVGERRHNNES